MTRILIAHQNRDMAEAIGDMLGDVLGTSDKPAIGFATNSAGVREKLATEAHDLLIADVDLPDDARSGVVRRGGLELARSLRAQYGKLPLVLVATSTTPGLSESVAAIANAALVLEGQNFEADLEAQVRAGLKTTATPDRTPADGADADRRTAAGPTRFVIEIRLRAGGDCDYRSRSIGGRVPYRISLKFAVRQEDLQELAARTIRLADAEQWTKDYEAIGDQLRSVILEGDIKVMKDIARVSGMMMREGADAQPAICFIVERGVYPIALEALRDGDDERYYWLERAPLWRQIDLPIRQYPLFQDPETRDRPINCLIVEADTSGTVSEWNLAFDALPAVKAEADWLDQHLRTQKTVQVGKIGRIWRDAAGVWTSVADSSGAAEPQLFAGSFREALGELLMGSEPWHLVHYAGHSHYNAKEDFGYILLPGPAPEAAGQAEVPDYVGTPEFARWLSRTRLVYMSSCRGSSQDFVFNLCKYNVPALTGFRWNIDDKLAVRHSQTFYAELFKRRSIEEASFWTWKHMFGRHRTDRVWASSQLVMQLAA